MKILLAFSLLVNVALVALISMNYRLLFPDEEVKLHLEKRQALHLKQREHGDSDSASFDMNQEIPVEGFDEAPRQVISMSMVQLNKELENLPKVLQDARAVPYIEPGSGGSVRGFKLVSIKSGSVYEKLGLRKGDVIKGVNGVAISSPQKAMELYQSLKKGGEVEIQVIQDGAPKNLRYDFKKHK